MCKSHYSGNLNFKIFYFCESETFLFHAEFYVCVLFVQLQFGTPVYMYLSTLLSH